MVVTEADPIKDCLLKGQAQIFVDPFFHLHVPQGAVDSPDCEDHLRVGGSEADVQQVPDGLPVDGAQMLARPDLRFFRQAVTLDAADNAFLLEFHGLSFLAKARTFVLVIFARA